MIISKYKVYIDHPDEAPEDVEVQEGPQGGLYYEKEPGGGSGQGEVEEEPEGPGEPENFDLDGYNLISEDPGDVEEGQYVYFEHPDGDYIVQVEGIDADGTLHWDGGYSWDPSGSYTSEFAGAVEAPEIPGELNADPDMTDFEVGDLIAWEDDAGMMHYQQVVDKEGASKLVLANGEEVSVWNVEYQVEGGEQDTSPSADYEMPSGEGYSESQVEFNENLAEAIESGDATALPAYEYMSNAGSIIDEDLAVDAYESILANDGNKTQRERMEKRLRGMGIDPEDVRESGVDPDSVPDVRKGTVYSGIDTETATKIAAAGLHSHHLSNWETWNDFYDHLTQDELKGALNDAVQNYYSINVYNDEPLDYEESPPEPHSSTKEYPEGSASIFSRLEDNAVEAVEQAADQAGGSGPSIVSHASLFLKKADDRRELYNKLPNPPAAARFMFGDMSPEDRADLMASNHSGSTSSRATKAHRALMWGYQNGADNPKLNGYNDSEAIGPIEPNEEVIEAIEKNQERIKERLEAPGPSLVHGMDNNVNDDGTITVYRGVSNKVTGFSPVESWTTNYTTASSQFDGNGVMRLDAEPEDIFGVHGVNHNKHPGEEEVTLLGHNLADKVEVDDGTPIDFDELGKAEMEFVIAETPQHVEAALFDGIFDSGMYTEHRLVDGEKVPIEVAEEREDAQSDIEGAGRRSEASEEKSRGISRMADEMAQKASQTLKDGMTSGTGGVGQATYGGGGDEEDEEEVEKGRVYVDDPSEAPEWARSMLREGEQGGLYYDPRDEAIATAPDPTPPSEEEEEPEQEEEPDPDPEPEQEEEEPGSWEGPVNVDEVYDKLLEDYSIETVREVATAIEDWDGHGYDSVETVPIWAAAGEIMGGVVPEEIRPEYQEFESHGTIAGRQVDNPEETVEALKEVIGMSREKLRAEHGDEIELHRGYRDEVFSNYTEMTDEGHLKVQPLAMESWTQNKNFATDNYDVVATRRVSVDNVLFDGELVLDMHHEFEEVTLGGGEEYTIDRDDWTQDAGGSGELMNMEKELKPLPVEDLNWLRVLVEDEDEKEVEKGRVYIDDPSEAPDGADVQEGDRGGLYYMTSRDEHDWPEGDLEEPGEPGAAPGEGIAAWREVGDEVVDEGDWVLVSDLETFDKFPAKVAEQVGMNTIIETPDGEEITIDNLALDPDHSISAVYDPDFEPQTPEEAAEAERISEQEEQRILEENIQEYNLNELSDPADGEAQGVDEVEIMGEAVEDADREQLESVLANGSLGQDLGVTTRLESYDESSPFDESDMQPNANDPAADVMIDTEDYLNLQFRIQEEFFNADFDRFFGAIRTDDIEEMVELLESGEETEIPAPYVYLDSDGDTANIQEGRHRAIAAYKAGLDEIPVRVILDEDRVREKNVKGREYIGNIHEAPDNVIVHADEDRCLYYKNEQSFETVDDEMMKFYKDVVWYEGDLEKAPDMWRGSQYVPEFVKEFIERAVDAGAFFQGSMESIPESVRIRLEGFFEEKMSQPQGWSLSSIADDMMEQFGVEEDDATNIIRNETAALANRGREIAYEERPESDEYKFYWSNPMEHRTTPVCEYVVEKTHPKFGGTPVSLEELKKILEEAIDPAHNPKLDGQEFKGATPNRIKDWVPHHQCRSTFIRRSKLGAL